MIYTLFYAWLRYNFCLKTTSRICINIVIIKIFNNEKFNIVFQFERITKGNIFSSNTLYFIFRFKYIGIVWIKKYNFKTYINNLVTFKRRVWIAFVQHSLFDRQWQSWSNFSFCSISEKIGRICRINRYSIDK